MRRIGGDDRVALIARCAAGSTGKGTVASSIGRFWSKVRPAIRRMPWAAILIGAWFLIGAVIPVGRAVVDHLALPLASGADARVHIRFGAGELAGEAGVPGTEAAEAAGVAAWCAATAAALITSGKPISPGRPSSTTGTRSKSIRTSAPIRAARSASVPRSAATRTE